MCYNIKSKRGDIVAKKAYLEITNVCNLACSFCHGTKREPKFISVDEFTLAAKKLRPFAEQLYFHLLGEPLLHPDLEEFFAIAGDLDYKVNITTNGTLLKQKADILLSAKSLRKVSISLHCYEVNTLGMSLDEYLEIVVKVGFKLAIRNLVLKEFYLAVKATPFFPFRTVHGAENYVERGK